MSIIRISVAELRSKMRDFTPEEKARLDALTDEEIERRALADPDAQPLTEEMLRGGQANRRHRLFFERIRAGLLGATVSEAADLDLPVWEVTDRNGHVVYLKAADVRRVASPSDPDARIVALDAVVQQRDAPVDSNVASARSTERQTT